MVQAGSTCCEGPVVLPNFNHQIYKIWMCISCVIFHLEMNFPVHNFILYIYCLVCVIVSVSFFDFKLELMHQAINLLGCQRSTFDNRFVFCASQKNDLLSPLPCEAMRFNSVASFAVSDM